MPPLVLASLPAHLPATPRFADLARPDTACPTTPAANTRRPGLPSRRSGEAIRFPTSFRPRPSLPDGVAMAVAAASGLLQAAHAIATGAPAGATASQAATASTIGLLVLWPVARTMAHCLRAAPITPMLPSGKADRVATGPARSVCSHSRIGP